MTELNPLAWVAHAPNLKGHIMFSKVWGSQSHNLALPTSDVDYSACYVADLRDLLSMTPPPETIDGKKPDFTVHEVGKLCPLLLKGNPNVVEMLFTEKYVIEDGYWKELKAERKRFLSKQSVKEYIGYAKGQLHKLAAGTSLHTKGGELSEKWSYHLVRLLKDALQIAIGNEPRIWKEGSEREYLMKIRTGEIGPNEVERVAKELIGKIDALQPWPLPDTGDKAWLNDWLLRVRKV